MIRGFCFVTLLGVATRVVIGLQGRQTPSELSAFLSTPIAFFFGLLFIHINSEAENTSVIIFAITWLSILVALYV